MSRRLVAAGAFAGLTALFAPAVARPPIALLWNSTGSAPIGMYRVREARQLAVGDWVAARPPEGIRAMFARRGYLPSGVPLVKRIAAAGPQRVCRIGVRVTVDHRAVALALTHDRADRALPVWRGCRRLGQDEYLLLNAAPDSLDSRYFGPLSVRNIVGRLTPLWIVGGASR